MKMNKMVIISAIAILALSGVGVMSLLSNPVKTSSGTANFESPTHVGFACVSPVRHPGDQESVLTQYADCSHNMYTYFGRNATRDYLFHGGTVVAYNVISVGVENVTEVLTDNCIANSTGAGAICKDWTSNGLQQVAGTVHDVTGSPSDFGNVSITATFTCTSCSNTVINATGLYNTTNPGVSTASRGGLVMFAEANFTAATLQTNDQINVLL